MARIVSAVPRPGRLRFPGRGALLTLLMADGAQAAFVLTAAPFLLIRAGNLTVAAVSSVLGLGYAVGVLAALALGRLADRFEPYRLLQLVQLVQLLLTVLVLITGTTGSGVALAIALTSVVVVLRGVGPVKDRIRNAHVPGESRSLFNSQFRRWFLVLNEISVAVAALLFTIVPGHLMGAVFVVPILLVAASLSATQSLHGDARRDASRAGAVRRRRSGPSLRGISRTQFTVALALLAVCPTGAALPSVGLSSWIAQTHTYAPIVVSAVSVLILGLDFAYMKVFGDSLHVGDKLWRAAPLICGAGLALSIVAVAVVLRLDPRGFTGVLALVLCMTPGVISYSMSVLISMTLQFSYGSEQDRGKTASYTRVAASLGMALGSIAGPGIFLGHTAWVCGLGLVVGALVALMPIRGARIEEKD